MIVTLEDTGPHVEIIDDVVHVTVGSPAVLCTLGAEQGPPGPPGGLIPATEVTGTSVDLAVNQNYILNNAALVTATLPAVASVGARIQLIGKGTGGWKMAQGAGQITRFLGMSTTTGVTGSLRSTTRYDCITLVCLVANTEWAVTDSMGNIEIT